MLSRKVSLLASMMGIAATMTSKLTLAVAQARAEVSISNSISYGSTRSRMHGKKKPAGNKLVRKANEGRLGIRAMTLAGATWKEYFDFKNDTEARRDTHRQYVAKMKARKAQRRLARLAAA